jgi:uncharacterized protein YraI
LAAFAPSRAQQIDYGKVVANVSLLNVRNGPGANFLVLGVVPGGTEMPVTGISADGGWFQVESPFGKAFVYAEFVVYRGSAPGLIPIVPPGGVSPNEAPVVTVMVPALNVRSQPVLGSNIIGVVPQSFVMSVTGRTDTGWYQVVSPFGTGWVTSALVTASGDTGSIPVVDPSGNVVKEKKKDKKAETTIPTFTSYTTTTTTTTTTTKPTKGSKKLGDTGTKVIVVATRMNVRSGPGTNFPIVGLVTQGTELAVTGVFPNGLWWEVLSPQGTSKVYVAGSYVVFSGDLSRVPVLNFGDYTPSAPVTVLPLVDGQGGGGDGTAVLIPGGPHVIVNTSVMNVRIGPGGQYPSAGTVPGGTRLEVTGQFPDGLWWEVQSPFDGGRAYVSAEYVVFRGSSVLVPLLSYSTFSTTAPVAVPATTTTTTTTTGTVIPAGAAHVVVNTPFMNVRSGPGGQFVPLGTVPGGTELIVTGQFTDGKWWEVESPFGEGRGYVSAEYVVFRGSAILVPVLSYSSFPGY